MNGHSIKALSVLALTTIDLLIASLVKRLSPETTLHLAGSSGGRIVLHVVCFWKDHRFLWHWLGIRREFSGILLARDSARHGCGISRLAIFREWADSRFHRKIPENQGCYAI